MLFKCILPSISSPLVFFWQQEHQIRPYDLIELTILYVRDSQFKAPCDPNGVMFKQVTIDHEYLT